MEGEMITRSAATKGPLGKGLYLENNKQMSLYELGGTQEDRTWYVCIQAVKEIRTHRPSPCPFLHGTHKHHLSIYRSVHISH